MAFELHVNLSGDVKEVLQAGITMSKELSDGAFVRLGGNASARLLEKLEVLFGFLTNPSGGLSFEGGLLLKLD